MDVDLTRRTLERAGLPNPIMVARDGAEALSFIPLWDAGERCPVVVLLDVNLPEVSGIEVYKIFKAHPRYRTIPILFLLSAEEDQAYLRKTIALLPPCLIKPVTIEKFVEVTKAFDLIWSLPSER